MASAIEHTGTFTHPIYELTVAVVDNQSGTIVKNRSLICDVGCR